MKSTYAFKSLISIQFEAKSEEIFQKLNSKVNSISKSSQCYVIITVYFFHKSLNFQKYIFYITLLDAITSVVFRNYVMFEFDCIKTCDH